ADRRGRRLVAGQEQRDQLVAELRVGEGFVLVVTRGQQQTEDVAALRLIGIAAPALDLVIQEGVDAVAQADETAPRTVPAEISWHEQQERARRGKAGKHLPQSGDARRI